ncbi:MAG TPA: MnhB domain-containing protein [Oligoflexia bacterium]|nr:MnhB domain-containing protein [Oligoflexia bacterium]HMR24729.1 MnhB domain-containing protein [Oligoflexia bacterium]
MKSFESNILHLGAKIVTPPMIVFAFYVFLHGHYGPGGGFQAGAILAAAYMLNRMCLRSDQSFTIPLRLLLLGAALGTLIYFTIGALSMPSSFLDYSIPFGSGKHRALGSLLIELGVTLTVPSALCLIFELLTRAAMDTSS